MHNSEEKNEALNAFKDLLVPIVRNALQHNEAKGELYWAGKYAYALKDMSAGRRLLLKILVKNGPKDPKVMGYGAALGRYGAAGLLAVMTGESDIAEHIIQELEKDEPLGWGTAGATVDIALKLPDKTTARRLMRKYETGGRRGYALNIATEIGDKEGIKRWMQKMLDESQSIQQLIDERHFRRLDIRRLDNRCLMKAVLYTPEFGKRFMKRLEHEDQDLLLALAGEIAAILGDRTYAKMVFNYFQEKEKESYFKLKAGAIAAALGDMNAAEEMICKAYSSLLDWGHDCSEEVGDILTTLAKKNLKAAEKVWKIVEKQKINQIVEFYLVTVAARTLENLTERE
jgi:hypothetical protein